MTRLVNWFNIPIIRRFRISCSRFIRSTRANQWLDRYTTSWQQALSTKPGGSGIIRGSMPGNDPVLEDEHYE